MLYPAWAVRSTLFFYGDPLLCKKENPAPPCQDPAPKRGGESNKPAVVTNSPSIEGMVSQWPSGQLVR